MLCLIVNCRLDRIFQFSSVSLCNYVLKSKLKNSNYLEAPWSPQFLLNVRGFGGGGGPTPPFTWVLSVIIVHHFHFTSSLNFPLWLYRVSLIYLFTDAFQPSVVDCCLDWTFILLNSHDCVSLRYQIVLILKKPSLSIFVSSKISMQVLGLGIMVFA